MCKPKKHKKTRIESFAAQEVVKEQEVRRYVRPTALSSLQRNYVDSLSHIIDAPVDSVHAIYEIAIGIIPVVTFIAVVSGPNLVMFNPLMSSLLSVNLKKRAPNMRLIDDLVHNMIPHTYSRFTLMDDSSAVRLIPVKVESFHASGCFCPMCLDSRKA